MLPKERSEFNKAKIYDTRNCYTEYQDTTDRLIWYIKLKLKLTFIAFVVLYYEIEFYIQSSCFEKNSLFGCVSERRVVDSAWKHNH